MSKEEVRMKLFAAYRDTAWLISSLMSNNWLMRKDLMRQLEKLDKDWDAFENSHYEYLEEIYEDDQHTLQAEYIQLRKEYDLLFWHGDELDKALESSENYSKQSVSIEDVDYSDEDDDFLIEQREESIESLSLVMTVKEVQYKEVKFNEDMKVLGSSNEQESKAQTNEGLNGGQEDPEHVHVVSREILDETENIPNKEFKSEVCLREHIDKDLGDTQDGGMVSNEACIGAGNDGAFYSKPDFGI